jgi:phenylacetate-CoA ligase
MNKAIRYLSRNIFLPTSDRLKGTEVYRKLEFLENSQYWSRSDLEQFQNEQLQKILKHASQNVPFYKSFFRENKLSLSDFRTREDLNKLPIVTKDLIRRQGIEMFLDQSSNRKNWISFYSSGSTGEPFQYYLNPESYSMKYASAIRGWNWMGYQLGDHYAKLSQNPRKNALKMIQDKVNRCSYYFIPDLKPESINKLIIKLKKDKPSFIRCYPDPLYFIAREMKDQDIYFDWVKAINTTGNILTPEFRTLIETRFRAKIYDSYSCEGSAMFFQNNDFQGYLGSMESAITEVLDKSYNPVPPGKTGMHITTEMWNTAMPFIRYNTQDLVTTLIPSKKRSSKELFAIENIIGRDSDILVAPDGNRLIVHLFTIYFEYFPSIRQFQVEQVSQVKFIFRLIVDENFNKLIEREIFNYWVNFLGPKAEVQLELHNVLPYMPSGKRRFLIRNKDIKVS